MTIPDSGPLDVLPDTNLRVFAHEAVDPAGSTPPPPPPSPIAEPERLVAMDTLRGVAILGILPMNIPSFAWVGLAMMSPTIEGGFTGLNRALWLLTHIVFDAKMISIFSMLFGAGIVAMAQRGRSAGRRPAA